MRAFVLFVISSTVFSSLSFGQKQAPSLTSSTYFLENNKLRQPLTFTGMEKEVTFCGLQAGQTYSVWAVQSEANSPTVRFAGVGKTATKLEFVAQDECVDLVMRKGNVNDGSVEPLILSIGCSTCKEEKSAFEKMFALAVTGGQSAQSLIQDVFIGGGCFDVTNVIDVGSPTTKGNFVGGGSSINIDEGVIISTGDINNALGPNNSNSAGNNAGGGNSDPDLSLLTGTALFDVGGIEFDFQPTISTINFDYVFASEEYCEYAPPNNSGFNDVFGFFISGPGIAGGFTFNGQNIAVLPGSGIFVSINNVNTVTNPGYFVPNQGNCGGFTNQNDIQFDGWTQLLTATANVIPCSTYHIRLMVADVGDGIFDSAVFLRSNSFSAGGTATGEAEAITTGTNMVFESCNDGSFVFTRAGGNTSLPLVLNFTVSPNSTATPGADYIPFPLTVVIPPGSTTGILPVDVINDGITEGIETIILSLTNSCSCSSLSITLNINDPPPVSADLPDYQECAGTPVILSPNVTGGIPNGNFTYLWSNGQTSPSIVAVPTSTTTYTVTVTDVCGATATTSSTVTVSEVPTALISGSGFLCSNSQSSINLTINFTGSAPWQFTYTINGVPQSPITTSQNPYILTVNAPGTYELFSVTSVVSNCSGIAAGVAPILMIEVNASATVTPATCVGNGTMTAIPSGGIAPYSYAWSNGFPNEPTAIGLAAGTYYVTVSDVNGCTATASGTITQAPPISASATSPTGVTCSNPTGGSINLTVSGGNVPYSYNWSGGIGNVQNPTGLTAGTYQVTITDNIGCTATASATVNANTAPPTAVASSGPILTCTATAVDVLGQGSSTGSNINYLWSGPGITGSNNSINVSVNQPGTYTLLVTNTANGCTAEALATVDSDVTLPVAVANGGELDCLNAQTTISGSGSSTGSNISYFWSGPGIVNGANTLDPTVNEDGFYILTVTNLDNGCTADVQVTVTENVNAPIANIQSPLPITCATSSITLNGSGSSAGPEFSYQWYNNGVLIPNETSSTLPVSSPGSYQIVVTNSSNGCNSNYTVDVAEDIAAPTVSASVSGEITCTQTNVSLTGTVNGNPANYSFEWTTNDGMINGGANSSSAMAGAPGTYSLLVTNNSNGCTATTSVPVTQDASIPVVDIAAPVTLNCLTTSQQINASGSSQGSTLTYTWTTQGGNFVSGQNTLTPTVNAPGTYILTINDSSNSCESTGSAVVVQDTEAPQLSLPSVPTLDCALSAITIDGTVANFPPSDLTFLWTTPDGQLDGPGNTISADVSNPGTYSLIVTNNNNGCTDEASVTVAQDVVQPAIQIADPDLITCANNTVSLNGSGSSTGAGFTYSWTTPDGNIVNGGSTLNPVVDQAGAYQLLITNTNNSCTASLQVTVDEDLVLPSANAGTPATLTCAQTQLTINGTGSTGAQFSYSWTGPGVISGGGSLTPVINQPGTYNLLVTNLTNSCSQTSSVIIGQDIAEPVANAGTGGELSCSVTQMTLDGAGSSTGGNMSYIWTSSNGNIVSNDNTLNPVINAPGTYLLTVTNTQNGCTSSSQVVISEDDDLPNVDAGTAQPITCAVTQVTLDGSNSVTGPEYTYGWTTNNGQIISGANTLNPVVGAPGIYVLTVTNTATNCTNLESVTVQAQTAPPAVEAGPAPELTCTVQSVTLDGTGSSTGSNFSYQWSGPGIIGGANTLNPQVNQAGLYQLLVTNTTTGCTSMDMVTIQQNLNLPAAAAATPGELTCVVQTLNLNGNGSETGTGIQYLWSTTDGFIVSGGNTLSPVINEPGTYQLLVTNSLNGCTSIASVDVAQNITTPTAEAGTAGQLDCDVQSLSLDGGGSSTGNNFQYLWSTQGGYIVSGANSLSPTINQPGTYTLLVTNMSNGCTASDNIVVQEDENVPQALITPPAELNCVTASVILTANASQGANFQYQWSTSNGNIVTGATSLTPEVNAPGTYYLLVTDMQNGCTKEVQAAVSQDIEQPVVDAGQAFIMDCFEELNYLNGIASATNGNLSYEWTTSDGNIASGANTLEPGVSEPGTYMLLVTNLGNGCTDTDQVTITREGPTAEPLDSQPPCFGDKGAIQIANVTGGEPPYLYSVDGGANYGSQSFFTNLEPATYNIIVQDGNGCKFEDEVTLNQPNLLSVEVEANASVKLGETYQINAQVSLPLSEITQITWTPSGNLSCSDCLNPVASPLTTTLYKVTVVSANGCEDSAPILLRVDKRVGVYVPTAFSPNGDGTNDVFMIFTDLKNVAKVKRFLVFNRWGETVYQYFNFQPNDPAYGWDGVHRGQPMDPAVFTWFAEVEFVDGNSEIFEGDVTLVK